MNNKTSTPKTKIFLFGNELLEEDSLPLIIKPDLEKRFPHLFFEIRDPTENLWPANGEMNIIDTAENTEKVTHIDNLDAIQANLQPCSLHDMDLAFHLKLLWKIGELKQLNIIAIPANTKKDKAIQETSKKIEELFPINP